MSEVESNSTNSAEVGAVVKNTTLLAAKDLVCASTKKASSVKENPASTNDAASTVKGLIPSYDDAPPVVKEAIDGYNTAVLVVKDLVSKHDVDVLVVEDHVSKQDVDVLLVRESLTPSHLEKIIGCDVIDAYGNATLASKHLATTYQDALRGATGVYTAMKNSTNNAPRAVIIAYNDALLVAKNLVVEYNDGLLVVGRALDACVSEARSLEQQAPIQTCVVVEKIVDVLKVVMDAYNNALAVTKNLMLAYKDAFLLIKDITEPRLMKGQKRIREEASLGEQKKVCADHAKPYPDNDKKESNYPNERGQLKKLCAKSLGCQQVQE